MDLIDWIGTKKMLRVERWRDEWKHWRAGIEWYDEDTYEFICEYPTLIQCLRIIKKYMLGESLENANQKLHD